MKAVLDTNVLIYDTIENSPFHMSANNMINDIEAPILNSISLIEIGFVLPRYGISEVDVKRKLDDILEDSFFKISWISRKTLEETTGFMVENYLNFKEFNDWIIAYDAYSKKVPLVSFDKDLTKKCKNIGIEILSPP